MTAKSTNIERLRTQNRKAYSSWAAHNCPAFSAFSDEVVLLKYLSDIGLRIKSIYDETDAAKIRMIASELVLKRDLLEIDEFKNYGDSVLRLLAYADYLEKRTYEPIEERSLPIPVDLDDNLYQSLTIAYYLSRLNERALQELGYKKFSEAFIELGKKLNRKPATIKNMRDEFDPYFDNGRQGWYQRELRSSRKIVFDAYAEMDDVVLSGLVKDIVSRLDEANHSENETKTDLEADRKRIKIDLSNIREIKYKQRKK